LKTALDLGLVGPLKDVIANADGSVEEGLPLERDRVGRVFVNNHEINVNLIWISDTDAGQIWLFSADTLTRIPELYDKLQAQPANTKLPAILVTNELLGVPVCLAMAGVSSSDSGVSCHCLASDTTNVLPIRLWRHYFN
jgi:MscS family membrane protein